MQQQPPKLIIDQHQPLIWLQDQYQLKHLTHPDITVFTDEASIGVDAIRDLNHKLVLRPIELSYKLFVFTQADLITEAGQNALLKLLEMDCSYVHWYFFTEAQKEQQLLQTLRSRLVMVHGNHARKLDDELNEQFEAILQGKALCFEAIDFDQWLLFLQTKLTKSSNQAKLLGIIERTLAVRRFQTHHIKWSSLAQMQMILNAV